MSDIKTRLKNAVIEDLNLGLQQVRSVLKTESSAFNELLLLQGRHRDNERKRQQNIIDYKEHDLVLSQVRKSVLDLIDELRMSEMRDTDLRLKEVIRQLDLNRDKVGPLYLVNCDRNKLTDLHWNRFDEKIEHSNVQFYFIPACPLQMPPSFAERMVWELLLEELEEELDALSYESRNDQIRMKRADFDIGSNKRRTERALKKYFCKRFNSNDFDQLLNADISKSGYQYITSLFTIEIDKWQSFMPDFLTWMLQEFQTVQGDHAPTFLFYVVVYMDCFVREPLNERQGQILTGVKNVIDQNADHCTVLKGFEPVYQKDIERWFRNIGERNPIRVKEVTDVLTRSLPKEEKDHYEAGKGIDMARMEYLQQLVYDVVSE